MENDTNYYTRDESEPQPEKEAVTTLGHLRAPTILDLDGESIVLRTHLGIGLKIERKTKTTLMDYMYNMDRISLEQALAILAIAADRDTENFKDRILRQDDYTGLIEKATDVLLGIAFPGDLEASEKKLEKFGMDEYTKNEIRARLGIPQKDLTGLLY